MLYVRGDHGQMINLNRALVIDKYLDEQSKKWEVRAYFNAHFCDVIRVYEIEDHARQCIDQLIAQVADDLNGHRGYVTYLEFDPCIVETLVRVPSSNSKGNPESTESSVQETSSPDKSGEQ